MQAMALMHETDIHGVLLLELTSHPDERGSFVETYRREWVPGMREMVQGNLSRSRANVLRGLHFHRRQTDYWILVSGIYVVGVYDLRIGSPTKGRALTIRVSAEDGRAVYLPPGVAHGFYAETDVVMQYLVDEYYTGDDEFGFAWNDPRAAVPWPVSDPILSERDRSNPTLEEVLRGAPTFEG
jgi:dTDP-4-dehydrorhamnose 3,5-epimerase